MPLLKSAQIGQTGIAGNALPIRTAARRRWSRLMGGFGHSVGLDDRHAEERADLVEYGLGKRGRRGAHEPEAVRAWLGGTSENHLVHRRHRRVVGGPLTLQPSVELEGVEPGRAHDRSAGRQRRQEAGHQPVDVKQRHDVQRAVCARQVQGGRDVAG